MENFDKLNEEVSKGLEGLNSGVSMGFDRMNKYVGIRRRIMNLIFGASGSGKSAFMHSAYILNPFESIRREKRKDVNFKVILFSMERSKIYILAKWVSRRIFLDEQVLIPVSKLLGWWREKLTKDEHDLFLATKDYIDELEEYVDIVEGPQNPTGIFEYVKKYAKSTGTFDEIDEYTKIYTPNAANNIVIVAQDHLGLTKLEKGCNNKKEAIDKLTEYNQIFRDRYGFIPVCVSQLNRNLNNPMFQNMSHFEPTLDDIKESGAPAEAADIVITLFDPRRYRTKDSVYNVDKFVDKKGSGGNYFRNIKLLKNTYGEDSISIGMGFHGATGIFKELPRKDRMDNFDYSSLFDGSYFLDSL